MATERLSARQLAIFTPAVALLAIFADAALGHGLTWENDPYWTYWVTKTFLIATVFGLGTAWLGVGLLPGALITVVHTLVLTVYYWTLSPIGLPSHPAWLDLEHTWVTGVPIHFGVIYLGYLAALFLWSRRGLVEPVDAARLATAALAASLAIVVVGGALAALALWEFPGLTWFVVRLLITFPLLLVWWAFAGRDLTASLSGAIVVGLAWATYGHFLGPSGLPDLPLRLFEQAPPATTVSWLSYRDLWLIELPIVIAVAAVVLVATARLARLEPEPYAAPARPALAVAAMLVPLVVGAFFVDGEGTNVRLAASGTARVEQGDWFSDRFAQGSGELRFNGVDRGGRVTPLPPHDEIDLTARLPSAGTEYAVTARAPLVDDPLGRFGTWWGIGTDVWHHGRSGIGSDRIPATHSEVALFAVGDVRAGGRVVAAGVPMHVMTMPDGLELDVGDPAVPVVGLPGGHLRAIWAEWEGGADDDIHATGYVVGSVVLLLLLGSALALLRGRRLRPQETVRA